MDPTEIRAIRGSLTRAAFARRLGVTSLTVLRWELAEGSKEARRPRAKMIEALRKLAAEGVGYADPAQPSDPERLDDEEDDDASEPTPAAPRRIGSSEALETTDPIRNDERLVQPLLERLCGESWSIAEDELLSLLSTTTLTTQTGRALATLGLVQAQLLGRLDVRGALTTLLPVLNDVERGVLPNHVAARAHVLGALLFSAPDSRFFEPGRVNAHAGRADELLEEGADELRVLLATARISGARFLDPHVGLRAYRANFASLDRASSPLARFLAAGLRGVAAGIVGDQAAADHHGATGLAIAERLGLSALTIAVLADRAWRTLRGAYGPEAVLSITKLAREKARAGRVSAGEPLMRVLACEVEALSRLGRLSDAHAVANEAMQLAAQGGAARYAIAMPMARLYMYSNRVSELEGLAEVLEAESVGMNHPHGNVHAVQVRAFAAGLSGNHVQAAELAEQVCSAAGTTLGANFVVHDAHFDLAMAKVMARDPEGARVALNRGEALLKESPSVWHSALYLRLQGFTLLHQGRFAEARQKFEATIATYTLVGDVIQLAYSHASLALLARAAGAPDAQQRSDAARRELQRYCVIAPELQRRAEVISVPIAGNAWREQSMTERLVVAVERLSVRGLSPELVPRELHSILTELFPGREPLVGPEERADETLEIAEGSLKLRIGVRGALDGEQRAALRLLAALVPRLIGSHRGNSEPDLAIDAVLPNFIAAAAATRQLKGEIARLSRSTATILVTGESGSGKEVVARAVHDLSPRAQAPYVVFNCASVPRDLFESQLFGHRRGAFTGASSDSPGVIRAADGGTLFLDEIGELPLETQPKLLRFLENGEVLPLGEQKPRRVDVRVLAATHRDLGRLVREGQFREDLFYRLNVVPLHVPPLRERKEDVVALARVFVGRLAPDGSQPPELGGDAVAALKGHTWPGNVRELRNVIERAMAYAPVPPVLRAEHLRIAAN